MQGLIIFFSSAVFSLGTYLVWPSRYNVMAHLNLGFVFIAYFVPAIILQDYKDYTDDTVNTYVLIMAIGAISFIGGLFSGFFLKPLHLANFSFTQVNTESYKKRIISITRFLLFAGIAGICMGYLMMGFVPAFAADPVSAKFFRGAYQVPFFVSIVYLSSFFILTTVTPVAIVIWYANRKKNLFLIGAITAVVLMAVSLSRGPAFGGVVLAVAIIMSFKNRRTFMVLIIFLFAIYFMSSAFYFVIGIRDLSEVSSNFKDDHIFWRLLSAGTVDITDQLTFMDFFNRNPIWTYGRTVVGGLIPSHYEWNPAIFTLRVTHPGEDVTTLVSGGLRLPAPVWGYVSFQWIGVVIFCFLSGFIKGVLLKFTKYWILKSKSILVATIIIVINISIFAQASDFFTLSIYELPPAIVLLFYAFKIKVE